MKFLFSLILLASFSSLAHARNYGSGGCGLGSMVMGKDGSQVLAITTNETGTQTFAISSGTSNCVDEGIVHRRHEARAFIELNHRQLANDISKGQGESLSSLAHLYKCSDERAFGTEMQKNYQSIFPTPASSDDHVEASILKVIDQSLPTCQG
jgi:hypothetical protein